MYRLSVCFTIIIISIAMTGCANIPKSDLLGHNMMQSTGLNIEPGAVVLIDRQNPFNASVVCSSKDALGSSDIEFHTDQLDIHTEASRGLLAGIYEWISGTRSVSSDYTNIRVQTISDTELIKYANHKKFSTACVSAIEKYLKAGKPLAMITSIMIGNAIIETSRQSGSVGNSGSTELIGSRGGSATTETTDRKIGVKFSQMQLSILTEKMGISENPKDNPLPLGAPFFGGGGSTAYRNPCKKEPSLPPCP